jgi:hypothetical protein
MTRQSRSAEWHAWRRRATNRCRTRHELEYELIDTGVFEDDRSFDVFVEHAEAAPARRPRRSP